MGRWVRGNRSGSVSFGQGAQVSYLVTYLLSWLLSYLVALGRTGSHWVALGRTGLACAILTAYAPSLLTTGSYMQTP